jgi:hypothetical protein
MIDMTRHECPHGSGENCGEFFEWREEACACADAQLSCWLRGLPLPYPTPSGTCCVERGAAGRPG